jgi:phenylpropionate dioxygenase-like ring-hydroxylating dioxygenase large terminal subunit
MQMTADVTMAPEMLALVDPEKGTVDRRIFYDQAIYELELGQIFARAWNFMCHDTQIPNPGDFFMSFIGEDRVIVVRDNEGNPQVLVNSCRHRGNAVCRAEEGHASSFMCTYHGWTYDLKGNLVGVPGFKEVYHEELDRESWGLIKAGKVETYKGFIFATMDGQAAPLDEFLGEVGRLSVDLLAERGTMVCVPGVQKYTIPCNWKLAVDNVWDWYHPGLSHASAFMSGFTGQRRVNPGAEAPKQEAPKAPAAKRPTNPMAAQFQREHRVLLGDYGHAISGPKIVPEVPDVNYDDTWRERPEAQAALGEVGLKTRGHPHIFPNLWFATGPGQLSLRLPKGPHSTEVWWFTILAEQEEAERFNDNRLRALRVFGPAGMLEQDDGENWEQSTKGLGGFATRNSPINYSMGLRHGDIIQIEGNPGHIDTKVNEHAQLWLYRNWAEWIAAPSWNDLQRGHTPVPRELV